MVSEKNLVVSLATGCALFIGASGAVAEGLERANLNTSFMFNEGTVAEYGMGSVNPSLPAIQTTLGLNSDTVAKPFTITTFSMKADLGDKVSAGLWYTNNGNGVSIDYGTLTNPISGATGTIAAELSIPSLAALVSYDISESFTALGGFKRVTIGDGGSLTQFTDITNDTVPDVDSNWVLSETSAAGAVYGISYSRSDIALRATLLVEEAINLSIDTTGTGGVAANGTTTASIGDALSLAFETGIAKDTLLFGNYRLSKWQDNQASVPLATFAGGGSAQVSDFEDGASYSLGLARRLSDDLAVSLSYFRDPGDGVGASELSPTGENNSITAGAKVGLSNNADLSLGATWSQRGDATTSGLQAELTKSVVTTLGAKLSFKF